MPPTTAMAMDTVPDTRMGGPPGTVGSGATPTATTAMDTITKLLLTAQRSKKNLGYQLKSVKWVTPSHMLTKQDK